MENTWQVCPKCDGNKKLIEFRRNETEELPGKIVTCQVCNGTGILSKETGLPPTGNGETFKYYPSITQPYLGNKKLYDPNINLEG
jgi:hypothetical protein